MASQGDIWRNFLGGKVGLPPVGGGGKDPLPTRPGEEVEEFRELSADEIERLGPTERQSYLRRLSARSAMDTASAAKRGAEAQAGLAESIPAELRRQLATSMMGAGAGGGGAASLASLGQIAKTVTPAYTQAAQEGEARAADAAVSAAERAAEAAVFQAEQGIGTKANLEADVKQKVENIKKDLRSDIFGIDADDLNEEILGLKTFYTDDAGNINPQLEAYIDGLASSEKKKASGWDIF
jgi:hypothetical protein